MDAEFSTIDPNIGEIISIAFVKPTGEELYLEIEHDPKTLDDWVKENIIPRLDGNFVSKTDAKQQIDDFIGKDHPYVISYINHFDVVFYWRTFGLPEILPTYDQWFPLDLATLIFFNGIDPRKYLHRKTNEQHNALTDARLLKESYEKLLAENNA